MMTQNQSFLPRTADETEQEIPRKDSEMKMLIRLLAAYSKKTACCQSKNIIIGVESLMHVSDKPEIA